MHLSDALRYGLFLGVAATADANRRHYHMATTWLPHLAMNTVALLLPDMLRPILSSELSHHVAEPAAILADTLRGLVCDNNAYVGYVAPLAAGYLLSHPEFNIYKGEWGEMELAGFGFDAIPHTAAGFMLSAAVIDTLREATRHVQSGSTLAAAIDWGDQHRAACALAVLGLVTAAWELGEYQVHRSELAQRGDISKINMQWSLDDTVTDCLANLIGWAAAMLWHRRHLSV